MAIAVPSKTEQVATPSSVFMRATRVVWKWLLPVVVGALLALLPVPAELPPAAWYYFAFFVAVVTGLILEPIPASAVAFMGIAVAAASRLVTGDPDASLRWALAGFANSTVWLVFAAFMFALGYEKTGLGRRIALLLVRQLGARTVGLGYAVMLGELVLAPFTPSNAARSGGTIFPVIRNIPPLYDSHPGDSARRIGAYLMWVALVANAVSSSMFLTGLANNLLALEIIRKTTGQVITMGDWVVGMLPMGLLFVVTVPWLVYRLYPPAVTGGDEVPAWADSELARMGAVSPKEWVMAALAVGALSLWAFGSALMPPTTVALVVISLMVMFGIVTWGDILGNKPAWNILFFFATLVTLADGLNVVGFPAWFARRSADALVGLPPLAVMAGLVAVYFFAHYLFASIIAQTTALLPVFLAAGMAVPGLPARPFTLLLCYSLGLMSALTPYASGPATVYYGSGYISRKAFWVLGLVFGMIFLAVLLGIGIPYLLMIAP